MALCFALTPRSSAATSGADLPYRPLGVAQQLLGSSFKSWIIGHAEIGYEVRSGKSATSGGLRYTENAMAVVPLSPLADHPDGFNNSFGEANVGHVACWFKLDLIADTKSLYLKALKNYLKGFEKAEESSR